MNKEFSVKYSIMQMVCMSEAQFNTPEDMVNAVKGLYDYLTEGVDLSESESEENVVTFNGPTLVN